MQKSCHSRRFETLDFPRMEKIFSVDTLFLPKLPYKKKQQKKTNKKQQQQQQPTAAKTPGLKWAFKKQQLQTRQKSLGEYSFGFLPLLLHVFFRAAPDMLLQFTRVWQCFDYETYHM